MTRTGQLELSLAGAANVERDPGYARDVTQWIRAMDTGHDFTAEELRDIMGDPPGHGDVLGTILRNARKARLIRAVGSQASSRPERHGAQIVVWERT